MIVRISDDAVALACGADAVADAFFAAGADVQRVSSWGMQWLEPLVEIDGLGYGPVCVADVGDILTGESTATCIGKIADHPFIAKQTRLTFARAGKTRPLSLDDYAATGGWAGLNAARALSPAQICETVLQSGLRGRGGAGFSAGLKWSFVDRRSGKPAYLICNADESEPGTFKDRQIIHKDPHQLIEGMIISCWANDVKLAYIYIRGEMPHGAKRLNEALAEARANGLLGKNILGTGFNFILRRRGRRFLAGHGCLPVRQ